MYPIHFDNISNYIYALIASAVIATILAALTWIYIRHGKIGAHAIIRLLAISVVLLAGFVALAILLPQGISSQAMITVSHPGTVITTFRGHTLGIDALAWSPDGTHIVSSGGYGDIQSWDAKTGKRLVIYRKEGNPSNAIAWSPNGKWIAEGEYGGLVYIWNANTGQNLLTYDCHCYSILNLAWSPDSSQIASLNGDAGVHIWNIFTGNDLSSYGSTAGSPSTTIAGWYSDGLYLLISDNKGTQQIWNVTTRSEIFEYHETPGQRGSLSTLTLSPDKKDVAVASPDETIHIWDVTTKKQVLFQDNNSPEVAWSPDSKYIATTTPRWDRIQIWDARTGDDVFTYNSHDRGDAFADVFAWSHDGTEIATGKSDSSVEVWQAREKTGTPVATQQPSSVLSLIILPLISITLIVVGAIILSVRPLRAGRASAWQPIGVAVIALVSIINITLAVQAISPNASAQQTNTSSSFTGGTRISSYRGDTAAWSLDGTRLVTGLADGSAYIWDAATGDRLLSHRSYHSAINTIAWSPDGQAIAAGYDNGYVQVWDAETGHTLFTYKEHSGKVISVLWSPNGKRIASVSTPDNTVLIWQAPVTSQGQSQQQWELSLALISVFSLLCIAAIVTTFLYRRKAQSVQKKRIITACLVLVSLFSLVGLGIFLPPFVSTTFSPSKGTTTGTTLARHKGTTVAWSPDSTYMASTDRDGEVHVWNADGGKDLFTYVSHTVAVTSIAWSPGQKYIASGNTTGTVQVWNSVNGHTLFTYQLHTLAVTALAWSPDGKRIASGGEDIQIWDAFTGRKVVFYLYQLGIVRTIAWSPDGTRLASTDDSLVKIWQGEEKVDSQLVHQQIGKINIISLPLLTGMTLGLIVLLIAGMILIRKSQRHLWKSLNITAVILFSLAGVSDLVVLSPMSHQISNSLAVSRSTMHPFYEYPASGGAWSPDGKLFATYFQGDPPSSPGSNAVHIWSDQEGDLNLTYRGYSGGVTALAWSHDGTRIASGYSDGTIQIWDAANGHNFFKYHGQTTEITNLRWSPDDSYIVSVSEDDQVQAWDTPTGHQRFHGNLGQMGSEAVMEWSPDGSRIIFGCDAVQIWDASSGKKLLTIPPSKIGRVFGVDWSPDSKKFVMASFSDGAIQERDASTGNVILTFPNITDQILGSVGRLAWSHNGKYIASGDDRGSLQLWNAATGQHLRSLYGLDSMGFLAWSPDDKYLAAAGSGFFGIYLQIWQI